MYGVPVTGSPVDGTTTGDRLEAADPRTGRTGTARIGEVCGHRSARLAEDDRDAARSPADADALRSIDALNAQMGREFEAHLQYLSVSSWFDSGGAPGADQVLRGAGGGGARPRDEVPDLRAGRGRPGGHPRRSPRPSRASRAPRRRWPASLAWEERGHGSHRRGRSTSAIAKKDHATQVFLQWFVTEQVEEIATMGELLRVTRRAGEANLLLLEDYVARKLAAARPPVRRRRRGRGARGPAAAAGARARRPGGGPPPRCRRAPRR